MAHMYITDGTLDDITSNPKITLPCTYHVHSKFDRIEFYDSIHSDKWFVIIGYRKTIYLSLLEIESKRQ
jgi:hypothetical protein